MVIILNDNVSLLFRLMKNSKLVILSNVIALINNICNYLYPICSHSKKEGTDASVQTLTVSKNSITMVNSLLAGILKAIVMIVNFFLHTILLSVP